MENFFEILRKRRSVRAFASRPVESEQRDLLLEAALRAPSSRGRTPWEFIVVEDPATLRKLAEAKPHGAGFLANAPLAIVVAADPAQCDVWIEDASIAAILIQLAATSLGLGSCWAQIRLREHDASGRPASDCLVEWLNLPPGSQVVSVIGIGYPAEDKPGHPRDELKWHKLHAERFGSRLG